ncbi:MAG: 5-(carboxyamino)imidazole ribonucleotide mutase [Bacillota bacterium]|nr:5-(carboxyamino)imidazole ribonucleotide mutase [Bacillota bacterium]HHU62098.1 5-(carboxyamino)imidazole ribonucleotide mutase [Natronincola sp.]
MQPQVGVIMGSASDWETMKRACLILDELAVSYEKHVMSAHRTPDTSLNYAKTAAQRGIKVIIAGAGGAAHLGGVLASKTTLPIIGVPIQTSALGGMDSLLSIVQMPGGIPVASMAIGNAGATNAGWFAAQILSLNDPDLAVRIGEKREEMARAVHESNANLV